MRIGLFGLLVMVMAGGCNLIGKRSSAPRGSGGDFAVDGRKGRNGGPPAVPVSMVRESPLPDPSTLIPAPPSMELPPVPPAPRPESLIAMADVPQLQADTKPTPDVAPAALEQVAPSADSVVESRRLLTAAQDAYRKMAGFEAKLTRREMVGGRSMPEEVIRFRFRREPHSVHLTWIGTENQGRELIYVADRPDARVHILTGRNEGLVIPAGIRKDFHPVDSTIRSKARHDIRESGMGMSLQWFGRVVSAVEADPAQQGRLKYLGKVTRVERKNGAFEAIEEKIPAGWEPLLPKGGKRVTHFDVDPQSPSSGLPVLVICHDAAGREVEYYWFDQLRPITPGSADFDPARVWRK